MAITVDLVEGWTGRLDFTLKSNGVAQNLTGMTVELILKKSDGTPVDTASDVTIVDAAAGKVGYTPDAADLTSAASPLTARWKVIDGGGAVVYYPSRAPDTWRVWRP